jgi:hypothetical protein
MLLLIGAFSLASFVAINCMGYGYATAISPARAAASRTAARPPAP